jgi:hypothetical protein
VSRAAPLGRDDAAPAPVDAPGWDVAAHSYKTFLVGAGDSIFWDNHWYSGSYGAITYGFLFYWLDQLLPAWLLVVACAGAVPVLFYLYQRDLWQIRDPWPAWLLAGTMCVYLAHGQDPFLLALALTMGGLALLARGHPVWGALLVGAGIYANPMGIVVGGVFMLADLIGRPETRRRYLVFLAVLAPFVIARLALGMAFSEPDDYLEQPARLVPLLTYTALGALLTTISTLSRRRPLIILFLTYAVVGVAAYNLPGNPLGNNIGRFFMVFGLTLFFIARRSRLRQPFTYVPVILLLAVGSLWQLASPVTHFTDRPEIAQAQRSFFTPALALAGRYYDLDHRLHVVAPRRHWEAFYLPAAGYPITRGWYRQADAIHNAFFYAGYDLAGYVTWLRDQGVEYVLVPKGPVDQWSHRERHLVETSPAFALVDQAGEWSVYRLRDARPLVVGLDGGTAHITAFGHRSLTLVVDRPGDYLIKVTWTPYWTLEGPGSLRQGAGDFTVLEAVAAGAFTLRFEVTAGAALDEIGRRLGL